MFFTSWTPVRKMICFIFSINIQWQTQAQKWWILISVCCWYVWPRCSFKTALLQSCSLLRWCSWNFVQCLELLDQYFWSSVCLTCHLLSCIWWVNPQHQWTSCQTKYQIRLIECTLIYFIFYWDIFKVKIFMQRQFSASQSWDFLRICNIEITTNVFLDLFTKILNIWSWHGLYLYIWIISIPSVKCIPFTQTFLILFISLT